MSSVQIMVDHDKKRLYRTVGGTDSTQEIGEAFIQYFVDHPDQMPYDAINDFRRWSGKIEWDELRDYAIKTERMLAEHLRKNPEAARPGRRAAQVLSDEKAELLVRAMQNYYNTTELKVFTSIEEAEAWLDEPRSHSDRPS